MNSVRQARYNIGQDLALIQCVIFVSIACAEGHMDKRKESTQAIIAARVEAIRQAYANNLIEGLDMGKAAFEAMLERARQPISNEEFTRREEAIWRKRYQAGIAA